MALSDDLSKLAARTKEAEERAAAAREKAKADLEADRDNARAVGEQQAEELRERAEEGKGRISDRWADVQRSWNEAMAGVRADIQSKKEEHDLHKAQHRAERAEDDARIRDRLRVLGGRGGRVRGARRRGREEGGGRSRRRRRNRLTLPAVNERQVVVSRCSLPT